MNNLITIPLAVLCSLNFVFQGETTNSLKTTTSSSVDDITTNINNNAVDTSTCVEDYTDPIFIHNADIGIFPGDPDLGRILVPRTKIGSIDMQTDMIVSGIKAADDGTQILVYANDGNIMLLANNLNSSFGNRIEQSSNMTIYQGSVFELTYYTSINKWVITNDNF